MLDLTEKISRGHIVFINSPPENCNLSLLQEGGRGSVNNFLCPHSSCPIQAFFEGFPKNHNMPLKDPENATKYEKKRKKNIRSIKKKR